jgi:two-component system, NarL family, nitrate/nitrite response regulator NarL
MNVLIVSDVRLHREGLACLIDRAGATYVVGAVDVEGARHRLPKRRSAKTVDIVLLDLPPRQCSNIVPLLRRSRRTRVVAIGVREEESEVLACAAAGLDGYVPVDASADDLLAALAGVIRRELVCSPRVAASLYNCVGLLRAVGDEPLTLRELEVVDLMNEGLANKEIARRLGIEASTVKHHVQNILSKLNVHRRGQAAAKLRGLIRERFAQETPAPHPPPAELTGD